MSTIDLTLSECETSVIWAIAEVTKLPYEPGAWNAFEFLIKEHALGFANVGATAYKCAVGFNIDFDLRCDCCGAILAMGTVDIHGPVHGDQANTAIVVLARSTQELAAALGSRIPPRRSPLEAAARIWRTMCGATSCDCYSPT